MTPEERWRNGTKRYFKETFLHIAGQEPDQDSGLGCTDNVRITVCGNGWLVVGHSRSPRDSRGNLGWCSSGN